MLDLKRKIHKMDSDSKTISYGLTSQNRKEFVGDMDAERILSAHRSGISDIGTLYFSNLFYLIDDLMHLKKPLIMASSGILSGVQSSLYMTGAARLADSSMRIMFDNCLHGQIACGGFYYFMNVYANNNQNKLTNNIHKQMLWNLFGAQPIAAWDLYEMGVIDWMMPSPNNVLAFTHIGNEIDKSFNYNFRSQDEFRHRAMIKSIIELFDRGTEHYTAHKMPELDFVFGTTKENEMNLLSLNSIDKVMERMEQISNGSFDFDLHRTNNDKNFDEMIRTVMYKTNKTRKNMERASPLALYLSYILYYGAAKQYNNIQTKYQQKNIGTNYFRNLLKYEYNALCWLMYFGDFWEGLKHKTDPNYTPKWKWSSMEQLLSSKDIKHLLSPKHMSNNDGEGVLENSILFNELPYGWMKPLEFDENVNMDEEYLLFPKISSLSDGATFDHSTTARLDIKNKKNSKDFYLHDFTMLRGTCPPNIQLKLNRLYTDYRFNKIRQTSLC